VVTLDDSASVILGIINRENTITEYEIDITINGLKSEQIGPIILDNGVKWEEEIQFTPTKKGQRQKVEFILYKEGQTDPYLSLYLWIDVI
jgi:uncharacterized membrane protein